MHGERWVGGGGGLYCVYECMGGYTCVHVTVCMHRERGGGGNVCVHVTVCMHRERGGGGNVCVHVTVCMHRESSIERDGGGRENACDSVYA